MILRFQLMNNKLILKDSIVIGKPWPNKIGITGITLDDNYTQLLQLAKKITLYTSVIPDPKKSSNKFPYPLKHIPACLTKEKKNCTFLYGAEMK